ncbi:hypothetical protein IB49_17410 [Geobacillus sp. LC300]|nr:hypothetical protein IB49_17410 [Geobacillus sp. LC300]
MGAEDVAEIVCQRACKEAMIAGMFSSRKMTFVFSWQYKSHGERNVLGRLFLFSSSKGASLP